MVETPSEDIDIKTLYLQCGKSSVSPHGIWCSVVLNHLSNASLDTLHDVRKWFGDGVKKPGLCNPYKVGLGTCLQLKSDQTRSDQQGK